MDNGPTRGSGKRASRSRGQNGILASAALANTADPQLSELLQAMRGGDFSVRMPSNHLGILGKIAGIFNEVAASNQRVENELSRVGQIVGRAGRTRHNVKFGPSAGTWGEMASSVNTLLDDLLRPRQ